MTSLEDRKPLAPSEDPHVLQVRREISTFLAARSVEFISRWIS